MHTWSVRLGSVPLTQDMDDILYDLVHTPVVRDYWIKKARISDTAFTSVNWPCLG
jgi:hypothetical protein